MSRTTVTVAIASAILTVACESRPPTVTKPAGPDAGAALARARASEDATADALDGIRRAASAATPQLDAGQKSGVNE